MAAIGEQVVTQAALEARGIDVARVPDAFGARGGCYVRGYTAIELELMVGAATKGGTLNLAELNRVQLAQCLLKSPDQPWQRLCGESVNPTRAELKKIDQVPPAAVPRLVQISDSLCGLTSELKVALFSGETWLDDEPEVSEDDDLMVVDFEQLSARGLAVKPSDVFGELGTVWVREYTAKEASAWERLATRGKTTSPHRLRWAKLAACLLLGPTPDSPRLVGPSTGSGQADVTAEDLTWVGTHIRHGEAMQLERMADALSGWSADTEARLAKSELPLPGGCSGSGASTD